MDRGYVLHSYPYRETSLILQVWTEKHGRLGLEEDFFYAYGFMPRDTHRLLHPRNSETYVSCITHIVAFSCGSCRMNIASARLQSTHDCCLASCCVLTLRGACSATGFCSFH